MVFAIIRHAFKMIFGDLGAVLKISLPIITLIAARLLLLGLAHPVESEGETADTVLALLEIAASIWVAVGWHRYVLLAERPGGLLPRFHQGEMVRYFLRGLVLTLIMVVPAGIFALLAFLFQFWNALFVMLLVLAVVAMLVSIWVASRCSLVLPAAAIDAPLGFLESWVATQPISAGIVGMIALYSLASTVLGWLGLMLFLAVPALGIVFLGAAQWLMTLLPLSVITTLYGVYAEGRELD